MMNESATATPQGPASGAAPTPGPTPEPQQRKRGRPFGSTTKKPPLTEQAVPGGSEIPAGEAEPQRRRRRTKAIDKDALAKQLVGLHAIAAKITGLGLIQIDNSEAVMLADAIESMSREYDLALDGKTGAFLQLMAAAAVVYGPRVIMFQRLKRQALAEQAAAKEAERAAATAGLNGAPLPTATAEH